MKILVFLLICFSQVIYSQQYNFITYSVEDGLVQNQVYDIVQDNEGYLWFATVAGLSRFDGTSFVNFSQRDGLYRNQVNDLYIDNTGALWIATIGGVSVYKDEAFTSIPFGKTFESVKITCIEQRQDGTIWVGTSGQGIVVIKDNEQHIFNIEKGLAHNNVRSLYEDGNGILWIGTQSGLNYIEDNAIYKYTDNLPQDLSVSNVTGNSEKGLWISTFGEGVFHIQNNKVTNYRSEDGLQSDWIKSILLNGDKIWFCSKFGVNLMNHSEIKSFDVSNGLAFEDIKCLLVDEENNLWLGSNGSGALKFSGMAFVNYTTNEGLHGNIILSIDESKDGNLWLGSYSNGITVFDPKTTKSVNYSINSEVYPLSDNKVWSLLIDRKQRKWIGTALGLNLIDEQEFHVFKNDSTSTSISSNKVTAIFETQDGNIWFGLRTGLSQYQSGGKFQNFTVDKGFNGTNIRSIVEDKDQMLWCGADNGLFRFDPATGNSEKFEIGNNLEEVKVFSLAIDASNNLWVGTDNGLYLKQGKNFKFIPTGQDARSNFVNFLLADKSSIWVGTNYGIYQVNYTNNESHVKAYTTHEGIKNLECNLNASFQDSNGMYWFGTAGGLVKLDKRFLTSQNFANAEVIIRSVRLFNEDVEWSTYGEINKTNGLPVDLKLGHNKNTLSFEFILFNYSNPDNVLYQYKLSGFEEEWSPPTTESFAVYRKLPPGEYTFIVKARTSSGRWTESKTFSFTISPPFWQTTWFYTLCGLAFICLAILFVMWRGKINDRKHNTEQLMYRNRLLALEHQSLNASLNRHFIFNALNSIQYYINTQDRISANKYLSSFAKLIRKNLDSSSSQNNYVSLAEELERTELYLSLEHMRFADKFEYEIQYAREIDAEAVMIPAMLLQPFIENSIWHGILPMEKKGKITITLDKTLNGDICFYIVDNGIGVEESIKSKSEQISAHESKGMAITSGRIELLKTITRRNITLKGPFQIHNEKGESIGTKVEIIIPANTIETFF